MILVVLVLGVASFIYYGRSSVYAQRDRLAVLELVNGRLEQLRAEPYTTFSGRLASNYKVYWLRLEGGSWEIYASERQQNLPVNNARSYPSTTTVQYSDADGGAASYDMLKFTVRMEYRMGSSDAIALSTYRAP